MTAPGHEYDVEVSVAFNAITEALADRGQWLRLSTRSAVAAAVVRALRERAGEGLPQSEDVPAAPAAPFVHGPGNCASCGRLLRLDGRGHVGVTDDAECTDPRPAARCTSEYARWTCERAAGHDGRHTAGDGGARNGATWLRDYETNPPTTSPTGDPT